MSRIQIHREGVIWNDKDRFTVSMSRIQIHSEGVIWNGKDRFTVSAKDTDKAERDYTE
jgi:hypothetical protein